MQKCTICSRVVASTMKEKENYLYQAKAMDVCVNSARLRKHVHARLRKKKNDTLHQYVASLQLKNGWTPLMITAALEVGSPIPKEWSLLTKKPSPLQWTSLFYERKKEALVGNQGVNT